MSSGGEAGYKESTNAAELPDPKKMKQMVKALRKEVGELKKVWHCMDGIDTFVFVLVRLNLWDVDRDRDGDGIGVEMVASKGWVRWQQYGIGVEMVVSKGWVRWQQCWWKWIVIVIEVAMVMVVVC